MESDGQDFDALLLSATGLRPPTPWFEKRVRAYRMLCADFSERVISEMLGIRTRRSLFRFARKIDSGNLLGALSHGNFGKHRPEHRGAFDYCYRAIVVLNRKMDAGELMREIKQTIGDPVPSARTVRRWLAQAKFMRKRFPKVQAALVEREKEAAAALAVSAAASPPTPTNPAPQ